MAKCNNSKRASRIPRCCLGNNAEMLQKSNQKHAIRQIEQCYQNDKKIEGLKANIEILVSMRICKGMNEKKIRFCFIYTSRHLLMEITLHLKICVYID